MPGPCPRVTLSTATKPTLDERRSHGFNFYDALIVASALVARCDTLLTEDLQNGRRVNGLTIVNPFV